MVGQFLVSPPGQIRMSLDRCATGASDVRSYGTCPPVVEYTREFQVQAAEELVLLPEGSAVAEMLSDYAVMREQARVRAN